MRRGAILGIALALLANAARADVIDRIDILSVDDETEARIGLTIPAHYLRHFPQSSGQIIELFFEVTTIDGKGLDRATSPIREVKKSPRSQLLPPFTITWNPLLTDVKPKATDADRDTLRLVVQFDRPVEFRLVEARDERGFSLFVKRKSADAGPK